MPAQFCFMVMPFGTKATGGREGTATDGEKRPPTLDFDYLWNHGIFPVLKDLGYQAIRADAEAGTVIVADMLQRLRYADLVLADVSIPNGNVYYEIGIRHAARGKGCVLMGADWSKRLFDIDQARTLRYPHAGEKIIESECAALRQVLTEKLSAFADSETPFHKLTRAVDKELFRASLDELYAFQTEIRQLAFSPGDEARARAVELADRLVRPGQVPAVEAVEQLIVALRDLALWEVQEQFITRLTPSFRAVAFVEEQLALARSGLGDLTGSIAILDGVVQRHGGSPERFGLLGGRYKRLWEKAKKARESSPDAVARPGRDERALLDLAIESYEKGMQLDLNAYYCSCNLPALLKARGDAGDGDRACTTDLLVLESCKRAERLGTGDAWLHPTLFGAAFRSGDVAAARASLKVMMKAPKFHRETTRADAELWLAQAPEGSRAALQELMDDLL